MAGDTTPPPEWTERQMRLLGLAPDMPGYDGVLTMAESGLSAWQIAAALGCRPEYIESLGGPRHVE